MVEGACDVVSEFAYDGQVGAAELGGGELPRLREPVDLQVQPGAQVVGSGQQITAGRAGIDQVHGQRLTGQVSGITHAANGS